METEFRLTVNGAERSVTCQPDTPLLDVLRHDLGLAGPKFGCGMGLCGACLVFIEGRARSSCDLPVSAVDGPVTTVEGCRTATAGSIRSSRRSSTSRPPSVATAPPGW
jgi:nicotinate dehydrogenase subunit A